MGSYPRYVGKGRAGCGLANGYSVCAAKSFCLRGRKARGACRVQLSSGAGSAHFPAQVAMPGELSSCNARGFRFKVIPLSLLAIYENPQSLPQPLRSLATWSPTTSSTQFLTSPQYGLLSINPHSPFPPLTSFPIGPFSSLPTGVTATVSERESLGSHPGLKIQAELKVSPLSSPHAL